MQFPAFRFRKGEWQAFEDTVSMEVPLKIQWEDSLNKRSGDATLWAWPEDLAPLALGHVLLDICRVEGLLSREAGVEATGEREFFVSIGNQRKGITAHAPVRLAPEGLFTAMHAFISAEGQWEGTGCFHRAGLFDPKDGKLLVRTEDIGRHNCIDRIAGWSVLQSVSLADKVLLTSARITASLCAKALRAGFRIMVSRSAVTTASIAMAGEHDATLVGFARTDEERFTVFADALGRLPRF